MSAQLVFFLLLISQCAIAILGARTEKTPCCTDLLGRTTCIRILRFDPSHFTDRCNQEAEFRIMQCCSTCNVHADVLPYDAIVQRLVADSCFDRYGMAFCRRFVNSTDAWSSQRWTCDGSNPAVAFRACRQSCGFCDFNKLDYKLATAEAACAFKEDPQKLQQQQTRVYKKYYGSTKRMTAADMRNFRIRYF